MNRFIAILMMLFIVTSCEEINNSCDEEKFATPIISNFPDSLQTGINYNLSVKFIIENSCGQFSEIIQENSGSTIVIKTKIKYSGCNCTLVFSEDETNLILKQEISGTYLYKFFGADGTYDTYTLVVYD